MQNQLEARAPKSGNDTSDSRSLSEEDAERSLMRAIFRGIAVSIPLMVAFWVLLVAVAVGGQNPDWGSWLGMAAAVGVLAGVFFGAWAGFVAKAHLLDDIDQHANQPVPNCPTMNDGGVPVAWGDRASSSACQ